MLLLICTFKASGCIRHDSLLISFSFVVAFQGVSGNAGLQGISGDQVSKAQINHKQVELNEIKKKDLTNGLTYFLFRE